MMGGSLAHEYMYLTPIGEDSLLLCDNCGYAANRQIARFRKPPPPPKKQAAEKVATPHTPTIDALAELLGVPRRARPKRSLWWRPSPKARSRWSASCSRWCAATWT